MSVRSMPSVVWIAVAQDAADGAIVRIAAGIRGEAAVSALYRGLREDYAELPAERGLPPITFAEWVRGLVVSDPEEVEVAS